MRKFINIISEVQGELFPDYDSQHREERFRQWFADSVAVTGDRPTVFYHATDVDFDEFNVVNIGASSAFGMTGSVERHGAFFAVDPKFAEEYIENKKNGRVIPVHLSIQKPFDLRDDAVHGLLNALYRDDELALALRDKGVNLYSIANHMNEHNRWELFDGAEGEDFVEALRSLGFDGAVMNEASSGDANGEVWVAFSPNQIKSIFNRGSYSTDSGKISEGDDDSERG